MIVITPGGNGKEIPAGGTIRGGISLDFSSAFSKFGKAIDMVDFNALDSLATTISKIATSFSEVAGNFETGKFNEFFDKTSETLDRMNRVLAGLEAGKFIVKMDSSLAGINRLSSKAENMMANADNMIRKVESKTPHG